jgi:response regulator of citrate/malate metabolism
MSKSINTDTLARVRELFEKNPKIGRRECGEQLGISENTARIYLNRLKGAADGDLTWGGSRGSWTS